MEIIIDAVVETGGFHGSPDAKSLIWLCEGCGDYHVIAVSGSFPDGRPVWTWNGSLTAPTLSPSLLVRWTYKDEPRVCHSFVRDGVVEFLGDCTHPLAGQKVPMKPENAGFHQPTRSS
jgi:hypothetical protein